MCQPCESPKDPHTWKNLNIPLLTTANFLAFPKTSCQYRAIATTPLITNVWFTQLVEHLPSKTGTSWATKSMILASNCGVISPLTVASAWHPFTNPWASPNNKDGLRWISDYIQNLWHSHIIFPTQPSHYSVRSFLLSNSSFWPFKQWPRQSTNGRINWFIIRLNSWSTSNPPI